MTVDPRARALARMIDHTLLVPEATATDVSGAVAEAVRWGTAACCVSSARLPLGAAVAEDATAAGVAICAVVGFPAGAHVASVKATEAALAVASGAEEIDMVVDLGALQAGRWSMVAAEIAAVRAVTPGAVLKVIVESAVLREDDLAAACRCAADAGADFVKTSTGMHPAGGATARAVALMRAAVGDSVGIKAAGGIRTLEAANAMVDAGATRLGMSATAAVLRAAGAQPS